MKNYFRGSSIEKRLGNTDLEHRHDARHLSANYTLNRIRPDDGGSKDL
jgi:hypothetical protein